MRGEVEAVGIKGFAHAADGVVECAVDPAIGGVFFGDGGSGDGLACGLHLHEAGGIPQFVAEVAVAFDAFGVEDDVAAHGRLRGEGEAQGVGAVSGDAVRVFFAGLRGDFFGFLRLHHAAGAFCDQGFAVNTVDDVERVEDVAFGFGHFLSFAVAHEAVDVYLAEGDFAVHAVRAHQHHARHPEEDDVEAGDEDVAGVVGFEVGGVVRPALGGEWPQRGGEPGVEHVFVLRQRVFGSEVVFFAHGGFVFGDVHLAVGVIPGGDAVPPPELARDAPVLQVFHPVVVGVFPVVRHEFDAAIAHGVERGLGELGHAFVAG